MNRTIQNALPVLGALLAACASETEWRNADALQANTVEVQVDASGRPLEIEYHVAPEVVPAAIHSAMDALHPGGRTVAAEKEYVGSTLYWELTKEMDGREIEAMFHPDGRLHSEEIEVAASSVPDAVRKAVQERIGGEVRKWEEIRDGDRALVEYHAKATVKGMKYKVRAGVGGQILGVVREVPAEIEVPAD